MLLDIFYKFGLNMNTWHSDSSSSSIYVLEDIVLELLRMNEFLCAVYVNNVANYMKCKIKNKPMSLLHLSKLAVRLAIDTTKHDMLTEIDALEIPITLKKYLKS
jgi:hypothetical protein